MLESRRRFQQIDPVSTSTMRRVVSPGLLGAAVMLAVLAAFIHVPAPHLLLLPLGVMTPEVSPLIAALSLVVCVASVALRRTGGSARFAAIIAALAAVVSALPLVRAWPTLAHFDRVTAPMLDADWRGPSPFSAVDFVRGIRESAPVRVDRLEMVHAAQGPTGLVIYRPADSRDRPVVVQIYGGAWQRGAPHDDRAIARVLASRGYVVVAIDYRHAPAARWPAQIDDVRAALGWVREHAKEHGGDASRMVLLGRSSGAHLALLAAYMDKSPDVRGVIAYYGPVDLADGWRHPPSPDPLRVRPILETFLGGTPDERPAAYRDASPITYVSRDSPPTLLVYGTRDHIVEARYGRMLDARLRASGATSFLLEVPWAEHAFDLVPSGLSSQVTLPYVERFLARYLVSLATEVQ